MIPAILATIALVLIFGILTVCALAPLWIHECRKIDQSAETESETETLDK